MTKGEWSELIDVLHTARHWAKQAHDNAEANHDNHRDSVQYEIMQETENFITRIDDLLNRYEGHFSALYGKSCLEKALKLMVDAEK